jgi:hypothetical protein
MRWKWQRISVHRQKMNKNDWPIKDLINMCHISGGTKNDFFFFFFWTRLPYVGSSFERMPMRSKKAM